MFKREDLRRDWIAMSFIRFAHLTLVPTVIHCKHLTSSQAKEGYPLPILTYRILPVSPVHYLWKCLALNSSACRHRASLR